MKFRLCEVNFKNISPTLPECLFFHKESEDFYLENGKLRYVSRNLTSNSVKSKLYFNTFFGAFPVEPWKKFARLRKIYLEIKARGEFFLSIWCDNGIEPPQKIKTVRKTSSKDILAIPLYLDNIPFTKGIIYPEILVKDSNFEMEYLRYVTDKKPVNNVKLAIIMPTYRREGFVRKNIEKLSKELFSDSNYEVDLFVIDNAQTLDINSLRKVRIIPNKNYGGAGGFARGILEILDKDYTHVLFSDDDIEFEVESIKRTIDFFRYCIKDVAIGGGMFNLNSKHMLNEQGGYSYYMQLFLAKFNRNMCDPREVVNCTYPEDINYFGWWFFSVPKKIFEMYGLPIPIFFRGDDQEFGMRIKGKVDFVSLLGVGVWHEEFYKKDMPVTDYYIIRNNLILSMIHEEKSIKLIKNLIKRFMGALLTYRYERAKFILKGIEDFLKGPEFVKTLKADEYHRLLMNEQRNKPTIKEDKFVAFKYNRPINYTKLKKIVILLTFNGHLFPKFLIRRAKNPYDDGYVIEHLHSHRLEAIFRNEKVLYYEPTTGKGIECSMDRSTFFKLFLKGLRGILMVALKYGAIQKKYRDMFPSLISKEFWSNYLGIKKS